MTRTATQNHSALTQCYIIQDQSSLTMYTLVAVFSLYSLIQLPLFQKPIKFKYKGTLCSTVMQHSNIVNMSNLGKTLHLSCHKDSSSC